MLTANNTKKYLLALYVFWAPINWVPFVDIAFLNIFKSVLFILLFLSAVNIVKIRFPSLLLSFSGLLFILLTSSLGMVSASGSIFESTKDIVLPFFMVWIIYNIKLSETEILNGFLIGIGGVSVVCFLSILSNVTGLFSFTSPAPWFDDFGHGALGGYRTGWANSLFLFTPFLLYYSNLNYKKNFSLIVMLCLVAIFGSQILSGGRAGFFAAFATVVLYSLRSSRSLVLLAFILYLVLTLIPEEIFLKQFRAENLYSQYFNQDDVNRISSGRYEGYEIGLDLFKDRPFYGYGFGMSDDLSDSKGYMPEIHNTWLKRLIDGGLVFTIPLVCLFVHCYLLIRKKILKIKSYDLKLYRLNYIFLISLFFPAIIITFLEPNYLLGSFQGEAFFWISIGYLLRNKEDVQEQQPLAS